MKHAAIALVAVWMLAGGAAHLLLPEPFFRAVPDPLPQLAVVYISGLAELAIGVGVLVARTRALAALAFALLCLAYLPVHVWDFFRPDPIFPVPWAAGARMLVQGGLIALGLWLWRRERPERQARA